MLTPPMATPVAVVQTAPADWALLERQGASLSEILVERQNVFDLDNPHENNLIGHLGNRLHWTTREGVVRRALLFHVGEKVNARRIHETERYLRAMAFLKDARIDPELLADGSVRAHVRVRDSWTLEGSIYYKLEGGQQTRGLGIQEQNLLGTGKTLVFSYKKDPVRTTGTVNYVDPQLLGSDWTLQTAYQHLSDGSSRVLNLQRPYTSLDTPWSASVQASSTGSTLTIYDRTLGIYAAPSRLDKRALACSWAVAHTEFDAWRAGVLLVDNEARYGPLSLLAPPGGLPAPDLAARQLSGPALGASYLADGYRVFRNLAGMDTPEDYNLGLAGFIVAGSCLPALGSSERAVFTQSSLTKGWSGSDRELLLMQISASGRRSAGGWEDALADLTLTGYWKATPHQITAAQLALDRECRPDPEDLYYLGALQGLLGYANNLHPGDTRWLLSVEQRMLTEQRWLGILRLGFVAFANAGAIHRLDGSGWTPAAADLGAGLRMGDLKSSLGRVFFLTVAVPLAQASGQHNWQLAIGNIEQF